MDNLPNDVKFLIRGVIYLFLFFVALNGLARTAEASEGLTYAQCIGVEKQHGNPCIHRATGFFSGGAGWSNGAANLFLDGGVNYAVTNKTRYATDGTPSQCTDPCLPCKGGRCKYVCKEHVCHWEKVGNGLQSSTLSTSDL